MHTLIPLVSMHDVMGFPIFVTCRCCDGNIIGCYAPNGEHCERPLEVRASCPVVWFGNGKEWKMEVGIKVKFG